MLKLNFCVLVLHGMCSGQSSAFSIAQMLLHTTSVTLRSVRPSCYFCRLSEWSFQLVPVHFRKISVTFISSLLVWGGNMHMEVHTIHMVSVKNCLLGNLWKPIPGEKYRSFHKHTRLSSSFIWWVKISQLICSTR